VAWRSSGYAARRHERSQQRGHGWILRVKTDGSLDRRADSVEIDLVDMMEAFCVVIVGVAVTFGIGRGVSEHWIG